MHTASSASTPGSTGPPSACHCWCRGRFALAIAGASHSWASTTTHIHVPLTWTHLLGLCGPIWSASAPALRSPGIILDPNQVLAVSVLAKASGELSPGPVTRKPINRTCRHLLFTCFPAALFSQQQTIGTRQSLRMRQILTRHPCTDLHGQKDHVLACGLLAGSGVLADTHFYSPPTFKQNKKKPQTPLFLGGRERVTHVHT